MDELFWLAVIKVSGYFSTELLRLESEKKSKTKKTNKKTGEPNHLSEISNIHHT
jgi:hypothetical protein